MIFLAVGAVVFWRKSDERIGLFVSVWLITFGVASINDGSGLSLIVLHLPWLIVFVWQVIEPAIWPALGLFPYILPDGRFVPRWTWVSVTLWGLQLKERSPCL